MTAWHSSGDVLSDATSPLSNVTASIQAVAPFYARTFSTFGRFSSAALVVPYSWGYVEGDVGEESGRAERSGFADAVFRYAINLVGTPALTPAEFMQRKPRTTLGASLTMTAPTGEYDSSKLINLGTNRWAFKPELGLSHPAGPWWLELYTGVWLFTHNADYFGGQMRRQDPMAVVQGHVVRVFRRQMWASLDATWYQGGQTSLDGVSRDDRQKTTRIGAVFALPVGKGHSIKLAYARGATARIGSNLESIGVTWQYFWFDRARKPASPEKDQNARPMTR